MKRFILTLVTLIYTVLSHGAIKPQFGFENGVPSFLRVNGGGTLESSDEKFKDGKKSVKFSWTGQAEMVFLNYSDLEASMKTDLAGVVVWIYNTEPMSAPMRFTFEDWSGKEICHFDFGMDFTGWRTAWIKYVDMPSPYGHYGDKPKKERATDVARMTVRPSATVPQGTIYIDRVSFMKSRMHDQITPDMQIPENNYNLRRNMWHWCRLWEWEQYPKPELDDITAEREAMLSKVESRLDEWAASGNPGAEYTHNTLVKRSDDLFEKYGLGRLPDGSVKGAPLMCDDEFDNAGGEMRIRYIQDLIYWYALDWLNYGTTDKIDRIFIAMDHAIDQGFAFGSGWGTNHHYGYQIRNLYKAMWMLRKEIEKRGKTEEYSKVLAYWSGLAECRKPFPYGRDEMLDSWNTLHNCKVISAMMLPTPSERYTYMRLLSEFTSGSMSYSPGTYGGFKVDGTTFHHGGFYPAYSVGAFASLGDFCFFTRDTDFTVSDSARACFKHILMTLRRYCNLKDWGFGICGRHPFNGSIPKADIEAFGRLAVLGDQTGSGLPADPELGGEYLALGGADESIVKELKKAGISASPAPEGFFVYNYGAVGIHRRDNWMITLKAFNSDVWGSEIYTNDNRYGRYQSYGSVQWIGHGNPVSAKESGYTQDGWDWNRVPGATTVHLPFDILENPRKGTLMERNDSRFPGVSSLEGRNGVLAFTYVEDSKPNFCAGATATKSVFCFDNRIVFIGTGISNNSTYPTETTLYQFRLDNPDYEIDFGYDYFGAFPVKHTQTEKGLTTIADNQDNFYIVRDGKGLTLTKQHQSSPSDTKKKTGEGDFVTAYIDHGISPKEASYEYMMLVQPTSKDIKKYSKKLPYSVVRADNSVHIVTDHETGITAYVSYKGFDGKGCDFSSMPKGKEAKAVLPISRIDAETIVMERSLGDGRTIMSVCTPDLGITQKGYTTPQESQPLIRKVVIDGKFSLENQEDAVKLQHDGNSTVVKVRCIHGQPVEFVIR